MKIQSEVAVHKKLIEREPEQEDKERLSRLKTVIDRDEEEDKEDRNRYKASKKLLSIQTIRKSGTLHEFEDEIHDYTNKKKKFIETHDKHAGFLMFA